MICNQPFHPCSYTDHTKKLQEGSNENFLLFTGVHNQCSNKSDNLPVNVHKKIRYRLPYNSNYTSSEDVLSKEIPFSRQFFKEFDLCCSSAQKTRDYVLRILFECVRREAPLYIQEGQTIFQHGIGYAASNFLEFEAAHSSYVRNLNIVDLEYASSLRKSILDELTQLTSDCGQEMDDLIAKINNNFFSPDFSSLRKILRNLKEGKIDSLESALQHLYDKNKGNNFYLLLKCFVKSENYSLNFSENNPASVLLNAFGQKINGRGIDVCQFLEIIKQQYNCEKVNSSDTEDSFARDFPLYNEVLTNFYVAEEEISLNNYYHCYDDEINPFDTIPYIICRCPNKKKLKRFVVIKSYVDQLDEHLGKKGMRWRSNPDLIFLSKKECRVLNSIIPRIEAGQSLENWVNDLTVVSYQPWISHGSKLFHEMNRTSALPSIVNQQVDNGTVDQLSTFVVDCLNNVNSNILDPYAASKAVVTEMIEKIDYSMQISQDLISRPDIKAHYDILNKLISLYNIEDPDSRKFEAEHLASLLEEHVILESLNNSSCDHDHSEIFIEKLLDDDFVESVINIFLNDGGKKNILNVWFLRRSLENYRKSAVWGEEEERLFWGTLSRLMGLYDHLTCAPHPYSSEEEKIQELVEVLAEIWFNSSVDQDLFAEIFANLLERDKESLNQLPLEVFKSELEDKLQDQTACSGVLELFEGGVDNVLLRARDLRTKTWQSLQNLNSENQKKYGIKFKTTAKINDKLRNKNIFCMNVCACVIQSKIDET